VAIERPGAVNVACDGDLLATVQQRDLTHLHQVHPHRVVRGSPGTLGFVRVGDRIAIFLDNRKTVVLVQFRVGVLEVVFNLPFVRRFRVAFQAQAIGVGMVVLARITGWS
jgi:hypothetical protein